jgi:hypothetical protein
MGIVESQDGGALDAGRLGLPGAASRFHSPQALRAKPDLNESRGIPKSALI